MADKSALFQSYIAIMKEELIPAMGCTEPIAIALGAARAREILGAVPERVEIGVSPSLYKNAKSVVVPNTGHLKGVAVAVAAGVVVGDSSKQLEVLDSVTPEQLEEIKTLHASCPIDISIPEDSLNFDIRISLFKDGHKAYVRIADFHTNIVYEELDGEVLKDVPLSGEAAPVDENGVSTDHNLLNMKDIFDFAETVDLELVKPMLDRQIEYNMAIAEEGLTGKYGAAIGATLLKYEGDSLKTKTKAYAAAGSDARMDGCEMPVVINSGSGNQGITCSVPVILAAREVGASDELLYRALVLSNLTGIHIKTPMGRLSAFCGAVSAGAGAGAGIAYVYEKTYSEEFAYAAVIHTVVNALAIVSGVICDGAKPSCAAKIAAAVEAADLAYMMFCEAKQFNSGDGIVAKGIEPTLQNIGRLGRAGMEGTNEEIVRMMLEN